MLEQLPPALLQALIAAAHERNMLPQAPGAPLANAFRGLMAPMPAHQPLPADPREFQQGPMVAPHVGPPMPPSGPMVSPHFGPQEPQGPMVAPQLPGSPGGMPSPLELIGGQHVPKPAMAQQLSHAHAPQPAGAETLHRMQQKPNPWAIIAQAFMQHHGLPLQ
jgi:hypothetical protein